MPPCSPLPLLLLTCSLAAQNPSAQVPAPELSEAVALIATKPAEAIRLLQQLQRQSPDLPGLHYQLGRAFHAIGDEADAEPELRQALATEPASAAIHNDLGIAIFQLGDAKSALEQFRAAATLAPADPNVHFNLAEALVRTGETNAGVDELRKAAALAPTDATLSRVVRNVENALASENPIKVDVRQVLVPVTVLDKEGHHVTGLHQEDFKIFEDGVEQKITGFTVETAGAPAANPSPASPATPSPASPRPAPENPAHAVRRTYLILIDTLHTTFSNFQLARQALVKRFERERSEDSQYVAIALGASPQIIVNVTPDPNAVLTALRGKKMEKLFLDGQAGGLHAEMERFRSELNDTRTACNLANDPPFKVKCASGMARAVAETPQIAELERTLTLGFLQELRALLSQLANARDRRTVILISDGFPLEPGREAENLLSAYFPYSSHCFVPSDMDCPHTGMQTMPTMRNELQPVLQLAARSNITVDTIDSRGLYTQKAFDASTPATSPVVDGAVGRVERNAAAAAGNTLIEIAEATGGTAFRDSNDLLAGLEQAFADGRDYYTLAYTPANPAADGKFRAIGVQVLKRNVSVNAKRGYWPVPGAQ